MKLLIRHGYVVHSQRGSHVKMRGPGGIVIVPVHAKKPVKVGILRRILKDASIDPDELR